MNLKSLPLLAATLLFLPPAQAKLDFPSTSTRLKSTPEDKQLTTQFTFANAGADPVEILEVNTSCGCTTAATDKKHYTSKQSGVVAVAYTIGLSEGLHTHTITVVTNEPADNRYTLIFTADL